MTYKLKEKVKVYYVDTNIFLNVIYKEPEFFEKSKEFLERVHNGNFQALTSSITLLEIILDMTESGYAELADKAIASIEDIRNLEIASLNRAMTKQAASFVVKDKLTVHDAYHLATAIHRKADAFITRDVDLGRRIRGYIDVLTPEQTWYDVRRIMRIKS